MARHPRGAREGQKARNQTYTIIAVILIIGAMIAFYYGPFGKNKAEESAGANPSTDANMPDQQQTDLAEASMPESNEPVTLVSSAEVGTEPNMPELPEADRSGFAEPNSFEANRTGVPEPNVPEPNLSAPGPVYAANPVVQPGAEAAALIASADALLSEGSSGIIAARGKLNEALRLPMSPKQRSEVKERLSKLSDQWLFSRTVLPNDPLCESYMVHSGDRLANIGHKYKVPYEILMEINNIHDPRALRAGSSIKVVKGPFHAKVYRSTFTMDVYLQTTFVRSFKVGLGKPGMETPTGVWRVKPDGKLERPIWTNPIDHKTYHPEDPDYPLGSRWIGLEGLSGEAKDRTGFAIHGTKEPEQIGAAGSQGCIRMHNGEAILVYNMLYPGLSQVEVAD